MQMGEILAHMKFLSTPSARRATTAVTEKTSAAYISIHALREEGDQTHDVIRYNWQKFLSTPSARRATLSPGDLHGH